MGLRSENLVTLHDVLHAARENDTPAQADRDGSGVKVVGEAQLDEGTCECTRQVDKCTEHFQSSTTVLLKKKKKSLINLSHSSLLLCLCNIACFSVCSVVVPFTILALEKRRGKEPGTPLWIERR